MFHWYQISNADAISTPTVLVNRDRVEQNLECMAGIAGDVSRLRPPGRHLEMALLLLQDA